jgi:hypothetical protein
VAHICNRYDYDKEKHSALEAWEEKLNSITSGKTVGMVVSLAIAKGFSRVLVIYFNSVPCDDCG